MSSTTVTDNPEQLLAAGQASGAAAFRLWGQGLIASALWGLAWLVTARWPDIDELGRTQEMAAVFGGVALALLLAATLGQRGGSPLRRIRPAGLWLIALGSLFLVWELATAKLAWVPRPFFVAPQDLLEVYLDDWAKLGNCVGHSLALLTTGYVLGAATGFAVGVAVGWSRAVAYWGHPILRFIGPLPATAWLPIAFFAFPSSWSASVFLIGLATGVPVAILTWSGVASVSSSYYDIARTLGASQRFLILKVAIPAAMPSVFVGLFMGLSSSFAVLVIAEMMGVKAGLGWYLQWAQGWAAYANMYAALLILAVVCSSLVTLLFKARDHLLAWQKGLLRW